MNRHIRIRRIPLVHASATIVLLVVGAGCGEETTQPPVGNPVLTVDFASQEFTSQSAGFDLSLRMDRTRYRPTDTAELTLVVHNVSTREITFNYSGQRYDFGVSDSTGAFIWLWSEGKVFGGVGQEMVAPGDSLIIAQQTWDLRDRSGAPLPVDKSFTLTAQTLAYARPPFVTYPHLSFTTRMVP